MIARKAIFAAAAFGVVYLIGAFTAADLNAFNWHGAGRLAVGVMGALFAVITWTEA